MDQQKIKQAKQMGVELSEDALEELENLAQSSNTSFETILVNAKMEQDHMSEEELVNELQRRFRLASSSDAEEFQGVVLGVTTSDDIYESRREERKREHEANPKQAERKGITDSSGTPLWTDSDNAGTAGEPIPEAYIMNVYGFAVKTEEGSEDEEPQFFELTQYVEGDEDQLKVEDAMESIGEQVKFMATDNTDSNADEYDLNFSSMTEFNETEIPDLPAKADLYETLATHRHEDLSKLRKRVKSNQLGAGNVIVVEGYVSNVTETSNGNKRVIVSQQGAGDSMTLLMEDYLDPDFGIGSEVFVMGNVWMPSGDDDEERPDILLNTYDYAVKDDTGPSGIRTPDDDDAEADTEEEEESVDVTDDSSDEEETQTEEQETGSSEAESLFS